jgi:hypothetical protein
MATTTATAFGIEGAKETEPKLTRAEILAKARAAKKNKSDKPENELVNVNIGENDFTLEINTGKPKYTFIQLEVWTKGLLAAMENLNVRTPQGVENCVPIANKVLEVFDSKFNEKA